MLNIKTAVSKCITCTITDILETIPRRSKYPILVCFSNIMHLYRETLHVTLTLVRKTMLAIATDEVDRSAVSIPAQSRLKISTV